MKIRNWDKIKTGTVLIVEWSDIVEKPNWISDEEAREFQPAVCKTVGWFVNHDEHNIRLTWTVADDGDKSVSVIPKGTVRDVKKVKVN